jgi:hypothetical protein
MTVFTYLIKGDLFAKDSAVPQLVLESIEQIEDKSLKKLVSKKVCILINIPVPQSHRWYQ